MQLHTTLMITNRHYPPYADISSLAQIRLSSSPFVNTRLCTKESAAVFSAFPSPVSLVHVCNRASP
jgi:hypothetical protein